MRLSEVIEGYWLAKQLDLSETTIPGYARVFDRLVSFLGDPEFTKVTSTDIRRYLVHISEEYGLAKRTVHDAWVPLSSLWTWAETELQTPHIIRGKVKQPGYTRRVIDALTADDVRALLIAAQKGKTYTTRKGKRVTPKRRTAHRDRAIILTLLDAGLRASELCALTIDDYDAKRGRLHVRHGKGDKGRFVVIGSRCQRAIWHYLELKRHDAKPHEPLFSTRNGTHLDRTQLRWVLVTLGEQAGVQNSYPHRFRHTFAINFLRNGGNMLTLKELLGHESLFMVEIYARIVEADIDAARTHSPADNWRL